jgi:tetratricopeptide (TPR) repeat protein
MSRAQYITLAIFGAIFGILYFGCDTKSPETKAIETSRAMNFEKISIPNLRESSAQKLQEPEKQELAYLEQQVRQATADTAKWSSLEKLSGFWFQNNSPALAANYAQTIAEGKNQAESWSITGSTYFICAKNVEDAELKEFCFKKAVSAFENTISLDEESIEHKINLALCYVDFPPEDNPMTGIQQLLSLQEKYPESSAVQMQLARLGLQTGQFEKALGRLLKVLESEPNNTKACCMIVKAYEGLGQSTDATKYENCCKQ